ncbi:transposase [uncultured Paraglaciecola sp.]|jgi:transposase|uniref:transposase n=1 Tax=uncultured Paraglaciecola sp. TaxID=1765024 RepID=UPI002616D384|nr:transposase [uncultured Paraglaciecola sp.]
MNKKYPDEFKQKAARQVVEKSHSAPDSSKHLDISDKYLYYWVSRQKYLPVNPQSKQKCASLGRD